jgi:hypothetical protein
VPGSLALAVADASPPDYGDVAIGAMASKTFTLTNPNPSPTGPLVFRTDDTHFTVSAGDCNQGDPAGLVNGSSCSFDVSFALADSTALTASTFPSPSGGARIGTLTSRGVAAHDGDAFSDGSPRLTTRFARVIGDGPPPVSEHLRQSGHWRQLYG